MSIYKKRTVSRRGPSVLGLSDRKKAAGMVFAVVRMEKQNELCYSKGWHPEDAGEENVL